MRKCIVVPALTFLMTVAITAASAETNQQQSPALIVTLASPAVVNIAIDATAATNADPLFQDPRFRRFFHLQGHPIVQRTQSVGSGFIYDAAHGYIVTNNHLIVSADGIEIALDDGRKFKAKLVGADPMLDIAVLRIDADHLTALPLGNSNTLRTGDYVVAIGNPFGMGKAATFGIVSAPGRTGPAIEHSEDLIETDASINPGNSGGALLDLHGTLVGINTAILSRDSESPRVRFAIPINKARDAIAELIKHGRVSHGQLGLMVQNMTPSIAQALGIKQTDGAVVSKVEPHSAAEDAGLTAGDVIIRLNDRKVPSAAQLRSRVAAMAPGMNAKLDVQRSHKSLTLWARLGEDKLPEQPSTIATPSLISGLQLGGIPEYDPAFGKAKGIYVIGVTSGCRADDAGVQPGDIILSVSQTPVASARDIIAAADKARGKPLLVRILRENTTLFVAIR